MFFYQQLVISCSSIYDTQSSWLELIYMYSDGALEEKAPWTVYY
jgi:hypothetical protein